MDLEMRDKNWNTLIKPKGLKIYEEILTPHYGKFEVKPLERGYGTTLGNSLRRVLLSSIRGAAIVAVKFDQVLHEFSTIKNIKEDVTDILLNLKEVNFKLTDKEEATIRIDAKGNMKLLASNIIHDANVEILNPDQPIATLYDDAKFKMEIRLKAGRGYETAETHKELSQEIGVIPMDSFFSPVKKVNFEVLNARVGQVTDYDRLILDVWTNGSVKPDDAVAYAAKILRDQLYVFQNFEDISQDETRKDEKAEDPYEKLMNSLNKPVSELELSVRSANCLQNAQIQFVGELVQKSESEMLKTKNFGRKSLNEIKELLVSMGLSFDMNFPQWKPPKNVELQVK